MPSRPAVPYSLPATSSSLPPLVTADMQTGLGSVGTTLGGLMVGLLTPLSYIYAPSVHSCSRLDRSSCFTGILSSIFWHPYVPPVRPEQVIMTALHPNTYITYIPTDIG